MNFFHCPIKIVSRNKGRSAVASTAYISGTRLENTWDGTTHDYTRKRHIIKDNKKKNPDRYEHR